MLKIENVSVTYGDSVIVNDLSFSLSQGSWLMLCGPNGAGKSTLLKAIAQSLKYKGKMVLCGDDMHAIKPKEFARKVGMLSQLNGVSYAFTVEEVVTLGRYSHMRRFFSKPDLQGREKVEEALRLTGMTALKNHSMLQLSGGEMQRTFLAQVFAQEPSLLLLDEPANHLDPVYQKQLFTLIEEWIQTPGRAVISVVHDLNLAKKYGTHAILMNEGHAAAQGRTKDVFTRENLRQVYGMDVYAWMQDMLSGWED